MTDTPPGWYPDATGRLRWFDGTRWTDATQPPAGPPGQPPPTAELPPVVPPATPAAPPPTSPPGYGTSYGSGYGAGYRAPATPPGRPRRTGLFVALAVLGVLLVAGIAALVITRTGGNDDGTATEGSSQTTPTVTQTVTSTAPATTVPTTDLSTGPAVPTGDPATTVQGFFAAVKNGDCATAETLVTSSYLKDNGRCTIKQSDAAALDNLTVDVGDPVITGQTATVPVDETLDSGGATPTSTTASFTLEQQADGSWLIASVG